jgi:hypothetical protein
MQISLTDEELTEMRKNAPLELHANRFWELTEARQKPKTQLKSFEDWAIGEYPGLEFFYRHRVKKGRLDHLLKDIKEQSVRRGADLELEHGGLYDFVDNYQEGPDMFVGVEGEMEQFDIPSMEQEVGRGIEGQVMPWHAPTSAIASSVGGRKSAQSSSPLRGFEFPSSEGGPMRDSSVSGGNDQGLGSDVLTVPQFDAESLEELSGTEKDYETKSFLGKSHPNCITVRIYLWTHERC